MEPAPVPFDLLFAHREWVRRVARALVLDESRAADLEQQVWIAALEHPPLASGSIRGWLRTVLRNAAGKMRRSEERVGRREAAAPPPRSAAGPDEVVAATEAHERVVRAVLELAEPYRTTVLLRYFEDLQPAEVAARTETPVETVRTRLRRALEQLRARLDGEHDGDRRAWCLFLLPLARPPAGRSAVPLAAGSAAAAVLGGVAMATATKVAVGAAVLAAAGLALWWGAGPTEPAPGVGGRPGTGVASASLSTAAAPGRPVVPAPVPGAGDPADARAAVDAALEVVDASGAPVPGASVRLSDSGVASPSAAAQWPFTAVAPPAAAPARAAGVTDAAGRTSLSAPHAGRWTVRVEADGFTSAELTVWLREGSPLPVRVLLLRGFPLSGVVRDGAGRPVAGAVVGFDRSRSRGRGEPVRSPATGEAGEYRLRGLGPGVHEVTVLTAAGILHTVGRVRLPGPSALDLRIGGGVTVKGRVVDDGTGEPIAGAAVCVEIRQGGTRFSGLGIATTAADGTFLVADLPPGDIGVALTVVREGYLRSPPWARSNEMERGTVAAGTVWEREIRLVAGVDPPLGPAREEKPLGPPGSVEGTVVDAAGAPAAGAGLSIWSAARPSGPSLEAVADAEGRFRVTDVPATKGSVYARPMGTGLGGSAGFTLTDGQALSGLVVRMRAAGSLRGTVRRADGAPATGAVLWWINGSFAGDVRAHAETLVSDDRATAVAADGAFLVENCAPGTYLLMAEAEGCSMAVSPYLELAEGEQREGVELVLESTLPLAGRVEDGDGRPVAGAHVSANAVEDRGAPAGVVAVTDGTGRFAASGFRPGPQAIVVEAEGFTKGEVEAPAGDEQVVVRVERVFALAGRVIEKGAGGPLAGVPVRASPEPRGDGRPPPRGNWETATRPDGTFRIEGVPAGTWSVTAGAGVRGEPTRFRPETLRGVEAGAEGVEFALARGTAISGRFVDPSGAPFPGPILVRGLQRTPDGSTREVARESRAGADGTFLLGGMEPGSCDLWVRSGAGRGDDTPPPVLVKDVATGTTDLVVTIPRGVRLRGRIANLPGPVERGKGGHLLLRGTGETWWPAMNPWPETDGTFETEPLDPDRTYDLVARGFPGRLGGVRGVRPGEGEVVVELTEGLSLSGRIVDEAGGAVPAGVPVAAWAVSEAADASGARASTETAADGTFRFAGLGDFRFALTVGGRGSPYLRAHAGGPPAEPFLPGARDIVLSVRRGLTVRGRLVDARGIPVVGIDVEAIGADGGRATTGDDGRFVLHGFVPGDFRLRVGDVVLGPFPPAEEEREFRLPGR